MNISSIGAGLTPGNDVKAGAWQYNVITVFFRNSVNIVK